MLLGGRLHCVIPYGMWFPVGVRCLHGLPYPYLYLYFYLYLGALTFICLLPSSFIYPVSSTFLSIRAVPRSAAFWSSSTLTVVPTFLKFFYRPLGTVPRAPTTIRITLVSTFQSLFSLMPDPGIYLSSPATRVSPGTVMSINSAILLSSTTTMSGRLCLITWSVCLFTFCVSMTGSAILFQARNVVSFTQTQWTAPVTLSCLFLSSTGASLLHSLVKCVTVSCLSLHLL